MLFVLADERNSNFIPFMTPSLPMCINKHMPTLLIYICILQIMLLYRIAGNFRGSKLSRIRPKNHFRRINFREFYYSAILYRIIYNFREFYFRESQKIAKRAKVIGLESFQLYGILMHNFLTCPMFCMPEQ